jgi:beta-mannosidase
MARPTGPCVVAEATARTAYVKFNRFTTLLALKWDVPERPDLQLLWEESGNGQRFDSCFTQKILVLCSENAMKSDILICIYDLARFHIKTPICNVALPADIYTFLERAEIIQPIYKDYILDNVRWIAETDWVFESDLVCGESGVLMLRDVTGEADVYMNGDFVTSIKSKFIKTQVNCLPNVAVNLRFQFKAPAKSVTERQKNEVPECPPETHHGFCGFQYLRRPARDFGWDFAPAVPTVGIGSILDGLYLSLKVKTQSLDDHLKVWKLTLKGACLYKGDRVFLKLRDALVFDTVIVTDGFFTWTLNNVELWWPIGTVGQPVLYSLEFGNFMRRNSMRIGFRRIKLEREPDELGKSFQFIVNNTPLFIKGVNAVIEPDSFTLRFLAKKKFNLLRIWAGGDYGSDELYKLADELGLLVWEEFKFACATYPSDEDFLLLVAQEVAEQTQRVSNHPSIALFSGNNEVAQSIIQNWDNDERPRAEVAKKYGKLFIDTVESIFQQHNYNEIDFVISSPSPGGETPETPLPENVNAANEGDAHLYDYVSDCWNFSTHPKSRFVSEFGFQSIPDPVTIESAVSSASMLQGPFVTNAFLTHRQHRATGNREIVSAVQAHFDVSDDASVDDIWYFSQIHQGVCLRKMFETFQRQPGNGGALLWQLNDVWSTISWSIVDYNGIFKYAFYSVGAIADVSLWTEQDKLFVKSNKPGEIRIIDLSKNQLSSRSFFHEGVTDYGLERLCQISCQSHIAVVDEENYIFLDYPKRNKNTAYTIYTFVLNGAVHVVSDHFLPFVFLRCGSVAFETNGFLLEPFKPKVVRVERGDILTNCVSVKSIW